MLTRVTFPASPSVEMMPIVWSKVACVEAASIAVPEAVTTTVYVVVAS